MVIGGEDGIIFPSACAKRVRSRAVAVLVLQGVECGLVKRASNICLVRGYIKMEFSPVDIVSKTM